MAAPEYTIDAVISLVREMFDRVDEQLATAVNALYNTDPVLAARVRTSDRHVDSLELEIDRACVSILEGGHVEGERLRTVVAAMRINSSLERIGDQCKNMAKTVGFLRSWTLWQSETQILEMADAVRSVVRLAHGALAEGNRLKARQVLALDRSVDRAYRSILKAIIALCRSHPHEAEALVHLAMLSKALERIADHSKSIARSVVFLVEGVDIRHRLAQSLVAEPA